MLFELKDRKICNALPDKVDLFGVNACYFSIMRKNRAGAKKYLNRRYKQSHTDMKVPTLTGTNFA